MVQRPRGDALRWILSRQCNNYVWTPFPRRGAYARDCTEGVTKSEGNRGANGDGDRVGVGNGIEIGKGAGGERSNTRQKQGHKRERRLEEEIESGTKIETETREEEKPDIRHIK